MTTIKLECVENPGPHRTSAVRDCVVEKNIPFGTVHLHADQIWRVYHTGCGLWAYEGNKAQCQMFLSILNEKPDLQWAEPRKFGGEEYRHLDTARKTSNLL